MAVNGTALAMLIRTKMDAKFKLAQDYAGPMAQQNPSYFIQFCDAIGKGIVQGSPVINFITADVGSTGAPPRPGVGSGIGIKIDSDWFTKELYKEIRSKSATMYGSSNHPAWCDEAGIANDPQNPLPASHCSLQPNQYKPYNFLTAMCEAISEAVAEHYEQFRILQSTHTTVYSGTGKINEGMFSGVDQFTVTNSIQGLGTLMKGSFWPILCQAIGKVYSQTITQHSKGEVVITGVCIPSQSQTCGVPGIGTGTGTAA